MKVELRGTETIRPYEQNPRLNDQGVEAVVKSLREFGFRHRERAEVLRLARARGGGTGSC